MENGTTILFGLSGVGTRPTVACSRLNDPGDPSPHPATRTLSRSRSVPARPAGQRRLPGPCHKRYIGSG